MPGDRRERCVIRPHYFGLKLIDDDDRELRRATTAGDVPPRCRLGGVILGPIIKRGEDPCAICPGNRDECGGRELQDENSDLAAAMRTTWRTLEEGAIAGRKIERLFKNELIKLFIAQGEKELKDDQS